MRVRGAQREMSSAQRGTAGGGEEEKWKERGKKVFVGLLKSIQSVVHFHAALDLLPPCSRGADGKTPGGFHQPSPGPAAVNPAL